MQWNATSWIVPVEAPAAVDGIRGALQWLIRFAVWPKEALGANSQRT